MRLIKALLLGGFSFALPVQALELTTLEQLGYGNLALSQTPEKLTLWYENRSLFSEWEALREVLRALPDGNGVQTVVVQHNAQPWIAFSFQGEDLAALRNGSLSGPGFARRVRFVDPPNPPQRAASSLFQTDLRPSPWINFYKGQFYTFLNLDADTTWYPGVQSHLRLQGEPSGTFPAQLVEGTLGLSGQKSSLFWSLQGGLMGVNTSWHPLWGWNGDLAYHFLEGRLIARANVGQREQETLQRTLALEGWLFPLELGIAAGYGTFPMGDSGPFGRVTRRFSHSELTLEGAKTNYGTMLRIAFGLDVWPGRYPKPVLVRLAGPAWMQEEYLAGATFAAQRKGLQAQADPARLSQAYLREKMAELSAETVQYHP